jgi:23S rRNA (uridine2552-2'-O)-methyltransferase
MREHVNDTFVKRAQVQGFRSRAAYKLEEIARADKLLRPGMVVVDLGAAPGSWSQVAAQAVGPSGRVVAIDILEMKPLPGVQFLQADMRSEDARQALGKFLEGKPADLVLCDIAPNLSGVASTDQARHRELSELALQFASAHLRPGGSFLIKAFQGSGYKEFMETMKNCFSSVASRKPAASRDRSPEMYLLGRGFNGKAIDLSGPDDT